jgi:peptide/nickel transport system permease protein
MTQYLLRRLLEGVPLLLGITLVVYLVLVSIPGGPLAAYRNNPRVRAEDLARLEQQLGLDKPVIVRYALWLKKFIQGDWGYSYVTRQPVLTLIWERFQNTIYLMGISLLATLLLAIPVGVYSAVRQYSLFDHAMTGLAFMGYSMPVFWLGLLLMLLFSVRLRWLPAGGMFTIGAELAGWDAFVDRLRYLTLPVLTLTVVSAGFYARYLRASLLDVIHQDYVRTAWAKGLSERRVIARHALKNALIPFVTVVAIHMPQLFTGAVVVETIFAWPGIGRLFWDAALRFDYPVLMGVLAVGALLVWVFNLLADLLYGYLDPRIRYG